MREKNQLIVNNIFQEKGLERICLVIHKFKLQELALSSTEGSRDENC